MLHHNFILGQGGGGGGGWYLGFNLPGTQILQKSETEPFAAKQRETQWTALGYCALLTPSSWACSGPINEIIREGAA